MIIFIGIIFNIPFVRQILVFKSEIDTFQRLRHRIISNIRNILTVVMRTIDEVCRMEFYASLIVANMCSIGV